MHTNTHTPNTSKDMPREYIHMLTHHRDTGIQQHSKIHAQIIRCTHKPHHTTQMQNTCTNTLKKRDKKHTEAVPIDCT